MKNKDNFMQSLSDKQIQEALKKSGYSYKESSPIGLSHIRLVRTVLDYWKNNVETDNKQLIKKSNKDNPVPSLNDIQVIEDLLEEDGMSEFDNDPRDAYFNGVRAGIQTYFKHYYLNGVETDKEQPKRNTKPCTCCKKEISIDDFYNFGCPECGEINQG